MSCCVVVPGSTDVLKLSLDRQFDVSTMVLRHYSKYWNLGNAMLRLLAAIRQGLDPNSAKPGSKEREMVKRFSVLLPAAAQKRRRSIPSDTDIHQQRSNDNNEYAPGTFSSPEFDNLCNVQDLQWSFELWSNFGDFEMASLEQPGPRQT
ncbi:uncharacterized protein Z518_08093 [Rhinocladiella mackenziei CBS 650.93]|uniref:Uncharacterized protein n=1 Tax=Rhinocladiella mackenziei CBS 650.93 TaxID=1442369 RepID=A0A0D2I8F7_9EURO|nr:uncharacterized protein Z518_08093 [Rhinocladiella mackenziei CBS 650.93]KIX02154.1 hypothetical protein Z518_08093 [Rhinocladiella mackenziei CBS 650.93]